jgi:hypothetical protein
MTQHTSKYFQALIEHLSAENRQVQPPAKKESRSKYFEPYFASILWPLCVWFGLDGAMPSKGI